jgi:glycosyltransferase involved in cell wall biosynthesis
VSAGHDVSSLFELISIYKRERPQVVHLNSSKAGGVGALAARIAGVPRIIFTAHGWPFWEKRGRVSRTLMWLASWATVLLSTKTIVVSEYDRAVALRMPFAKKKIVRIYNGIDESLPLAEGERIRSAFPSQARITGTIGELNKNKNQIALVEEARKNPHLFVAIVGEGEERGALEAKIREYGLSDRVKLFGFLPAAEVLKGFDTFALPSKKEGLPYVLLEARAAGLPIEANRVGGIGEILDAPDLHEFSLSHMLKETVSLYG